MAIKLIGVLTVCLVGLVVSQVYCGEVTEDRCNDPDTKWLTEPETDTDESHRMQVKLCKEVWERALQAVMPTLDPKDLVNVRYIVINMISGNKGRDFRGDQLEMPYKNAQNGVVTFLEGSTGTFLNVKTKEDEFNKAYNEWVYEPCGRILDKLSPISEKYFDLSLHNAWIAGEMDRYILEWSRKGRICNNLRGRGYTSSPDKDFRQETFESLASRPVKSVLNRLMGFTDLRD